MIMWNIEQLSQTYHLMTRLVLHCLFHLTIFFLHFDKATTQFKFNDEEVFLVVLITFELFLFFLSFFMPLYFDN